MIVSGAGVLLAWNAGLLRSSFIRFVSWQCGRPIDVRGALHLHLLAASPRIEAEQVTIGNPPWTKPGTTAEIAKLTVEFAPLLSRQSGLRLLKSTPRSCTSRATTRDGRTGSESTPINPRVDHCL